MDRFQDDHQETSENLQNKFNTAYQIAKDLLCLIEFEANKNTFNNDTKIGSADLGAVMAHETIEICKKRFRKISDGKLPWESRDEVD